MLSILNPPRIKRVCQQRRLTRYIADYAGRFYWHLFGYAAYYLVRKNFALAMPYLIEQGSLVATSASPFPVSPSPMDFRNSSWDRSLTARIRAFSCRLA